MFVPIKSQEALDSAVELIERNQRLQSLRLFLTKAQEPCAAPGKLAELFDGNAVGPLLHVLEEEDMLCGSSHTVDLRGVEWGGGGGGVEFFEGSVGKAASKTTWECHQDRRVAKIEGWPR